MKICKQLTKLTTALAVTAIAALTALQPTHATATDTYPKREVRGVWVATVWANCYPKSGYDQTSMQSECTTKLDKLQAAGINTIYFQVRPMADRFYNITSCTANGHTYAVYEPTSAWACGTRGGTLSWDPFAYWVQQCHARGMEIHAWINPFRFSSSKTKYDTSQDKAVYDWLIHNSTTKGEDYVFNPALENVRTRINNVCAVLTGAYDIDGIVFDDYFYNSTGLTTDMSQNPGDKPQYVAYQNAGGTLGVADWRRQNINEVIQGVCNTIHSIKPYVKFGVAPQGGVWGGMKQEDYAAITDLPTITWTDNIYDGLFCDPLAWLRAGTIDYISPQLYWKRNHSTNPFEPMTTWWSKVANHFGRHFYASHSITFIENNNTTINYQEVAAQIDLNRQHHTGAFGSVLYSSRAIDGGVVEGLGSYLKSNKFQHPSATPEVTWRGGSDPGKVVGLAKSGATLSWTAIGNNRYIAYAIPNSVIPPDAASDEGGYRAEYIIDVPYGHSVTIPSGKTSGYWYAVSVLDRYGHEWEAATLNAPAFEPAEVTLGNPADGVTAALNQQFSWTGTAGATFTFEVSTAADFATVNYTRSGTDMHSHTVDFSDWASHQTLYWRVRASKTGLLSATSAVRTIITPTKPDCTISLTAPAANADAEMQQTFSWTGTAGGQFVFEISQSRDFGSVRHTATGIDLNQTTVDFSTWPSETQFFWRVKVSKSGFNTVTSAVRSFTTPPTPTFSAPKLLRPANNAVFTADSAYIHFVPSQTGADQTILEVSRAQDFSSLAIPARTEWTTDPGDVDWWQTTVPTAQLTDGTYYWRVRATKKGMNDGISEVRTFTISAGRAASNTESGYTPYVEDYEYPLASHLDGGPNNMMLTNLWLRNGSHNPMGLDGSLCRDFAVRPAADNQPPIIYIAGRTANSDDAGKFLARYNAHTGERLQDLTLNYTRTGFRACNGVVIDEANNIIVHDLVLANGHLALFKVNPKTGATTKMIDITTPVRVDHLTIVGTVDNNTTYYIYAAGNGADKLYCWRVLNGSNDATWAMENIATGGAARVEVYPGEGSGEHYLVDGGSDYPELYTWSASSVTSYMKNYDFTATNSHAIGGTMFDHGGDIYMAMPVDAPLESGTTYKWSIFGLAANGSFDQLNQMFTFPHEGMGNYVNGGWDYGAPVRLLQDDATGTSRARVAGMQRTTVFAYSPGNGMAAYSLMRTVITGADAPEIAPVDTVDEWYTMQGIRVNPANLAPGLYLHRTAAGTAKQIIR